MAIFAANAIHFRRILRGEQPGNAENAVYNVRMNSGDYK